MISQDRMSPNIDRGFFFLPTFVEGINIISPDPNFSSPNIGIFILKIIVGASQGVAKLRKY